MVLNTKRISFVSFSPIVTVWLAIPSFSCQAFDRIGLGWKADAIHRPTIGISNTVLRHYQGLVID